MSENVEYPEDRSHCDVSPVEVGPVSDAVFGRMLTRFIHSGLAIPGEMLACAVKLGLVPQDR
jgi:hypothetical protein